MRHCKECPFCLISIHAPREGGDNAPEQTMGNPNISIHAPREGGDKRTAPLPQSPVNFNPRPPRGGRLVRLPEIIGAIVISIHAPREGGDRRCPGAGGCICGFQSTPPARGATAVSPPKDCSRDAISIHAPREGGDTM